MLKVGDVTNYKDRFWMLDSRKKPYEVKLTKQLTNEIKRSSEGYFSEYHSKQKLGNCFSVVEVIKTDDPTAVVYAVDPKLLFVSKEAAQQSIRDHRKAVVAKKMLFN